MSDETTRIELGDELDLHHFHPRDAKPLVREFIDAARSRGIRSVRIVHGRGRSVLKSIVLRELAGNENVASFADERGNWGATIAVLRIEE